MRHDLSAVVIGGGIGGLVTAARLAKAGYEVDLVEKNADVGGKMGRVCFDDCTFDTGPSLITMPFVLEEFFASMGTDLQTEVPLQPINPACHYRWLDGTTLNVPFALDDVADAIATISPEDGPAVERYLADAEFLYDATKDVFLFNRFDGFREFLKPRNLPLLRSLPRLRFTSTLHNVHASLFTSSKVVQLFDRFATYNGSSPYLAPATLMVIPWVEFGYGAWYPTGGIYTIAEAIARTAAAAGVRIHTSTAVDSIDVVDGRAVAAIAGSQRFEARHIVSNIDVSHTRRQLLKQPTAPARDLSMSGVVLLLSVEEEDFGLAHHNVFFSEDYQREFTALFTQRQLATDMTIYLSRSCASDSSQAARGRENWFILVNAPAGIELTAEQEHAYAQAVLDRLARYGVRPRVRQMQIRTPSFHARLWNAEGGAIYGRSSNSMFAAFLRQQQRSAAVRNLWYVGGSAHPGGGVPLVTLSGSIAAREILASDAHTFVHSR